MVDIDRQIAAATRGIQTRDVDGVRSHVQTLSQVYPAPIDDVWDAVTAAERIPRWFLPVSGELHAGGHYQFEGNAGGDILECDPPRDGRAGYTVTWGMGGGRPAIVRIGLVAIDAESTRVELTNIAAIDSLPEGMWQQFGPSGTGMGWDSGLLGLGLHLATDAAVDDPASWPMTDEGRSFMRLSADAWAEAHQVDGATADEAAAAADATYRLYTGQS